MRGISKLGCLASIPPVLGHLSVDGSLSTYVHSISYYKHAHCPGIYMPIVMKLQYKTVPYFAKIKYSKTNMPLLIQ